MIENQTRPANTRRRRPNGRKHFSSPTAGKRPRIANQVVPLLEEIAQRLRYCRLSHADRAWLHEYLDVLLDHVS